MSFFFCSKTVLYPNCYDVILSYTMNTNNFLAHLTNTAMTHTNIIFVDLVLGSICNCVLPQALRTSAVRHDPNYQPHDSEKRRLRSAFNCLSSISMRQKHLSTSSLVLQSHIRGCLSSSWPSWELRKSINRSLKDR